MKVIDFYKSSKHHGKYNLFIEDENTHVNVLLDKDEILKIAAMLKGNGF